MIWYYFYIILFQWIVYVIGKEKGSFVLGRQNRMIECRLICVKAANVTSFFPLTLFPLGMKMKSGTFELYHLTPIVLNIHCLFGQQEKIGNLLSGLNLLMYKAGSPKHIVGSLCSQIREETGGKGNLSGKFIFLSPFGFHDCYLFFPFGRFWERKGNFLTLSKAKGGFGVRIANFPLSRLLIPCPYAS